MHAEVINNMYNVLLPSAVVAMWLYCKSEFDKCKKDRQVQWKAILKLSRIVHSVKECPVNGCGLRKEAFEALQELDEDLDPKEVRDMAMKDLNIKAEVSRYHVPA